jgi:hypothetical protein
LLGDRKSLVGLRSWFLEWSSLVLEILYWRNFQLYGILNKQAIETSKALSKKAQISTERMERVTDSMHDIAKKTKQETVSMKIITLVTLFFLPGTFISVSWAADFSQHHTTIA